MSKIFIPDTNYACYVVQNEDTIRAYKEQPRHDSEIEYRDYYVHSDYMYKDDTQNFGRYGELPVCLSNDVITDEVYYRVDFPLILVGFIILCIIILGIPLKVFVRLFRRFQ